MKITKNKVASLTYSLTLNDFDGQIIETIGKEGAVEFLFGNGKLLPAFEQALEGQVAGDSFRFSIPASEAYGEFNSNAVIELSKEVFMRNGEINNEILILGNEIPMMDNQGRRMNGIVKEVKEDAVIMDFNHPMAGNNLFFKGIVAFVREATDEELNPPTQGCGCGSGNGHHHDDDSCGCGSSDSESDSCCSSDGDQQHESHGGCGCGA